MKYNSVDIFALVLFVWFVKFYWNFCSIFIHFGLSDIDYPFNSRLAVCEFEYTIPLLQFHTKILQGGRITRSWCKINFFPLFFEFLLHVVSSCCNSSHRQCTRTFYRLTFFLSRTYAMFYKSWDIHLNLIFSLIFFITFKTVFV